MCGLYSKMGKERELLQIPLDMMRLTHVKPEKKQFFSGIAYFISFVRFLYIYLLYKYFVELGDFHVIKLAEGVNSVSTYMQAYSKLSIIIFYQKEFLWLLDNLNRFWETPNDYPFMFQFARFYKLSMYGTVVAHVVYAVLYQNLIVACWVPDWHKYARVCTIAGQVLSFSWDVIYVAACDLFFLNMCAVLGQEFRTLADELYKMDDVYDINQLREHMHRCIEQHKFLLKYTKRFSQVFNIVLFSQYFMSMTSICMSMFIVTEFENMLEALPMIIYTVSVTMQLAIYCYAADTVTDVASKMSFYFYSMRWYDKPTMIQKYLPLVTSRCQKEMHFKAGNMFLINRETFTIVFKTAFSLYTLFKKMKD